MTTPPTGKVSDAPFKIALRCFALQRQVLRHDRHARLTERTLAQWARAHTISLRAATRSAYPLAQHLRRHLRCASRARRKRDQQQSALAATRTADIRVIRAKLMIALTLDTDAAVPLLRSALRDLRAR